MTQPAGAPGVAATDEVLASGRHACFIYCDDEDRRSTIGSFLAAGLAAGERVVYMTDGTPPEEVRAWVAAAGGDTGAAWADAVNVVPAEAVYHPAGIFDPSAAIARLEAANREAVQAGCPGRRSTAEMTWALRGMPGADRLIEYETQVNDIVARYPVKPVCQYDARRFDGATILKILQVHPMVVVRGQVVHNPYYRVAHLGV